MSDRLADDDMLRHYSAALDEVFRLRQILAFEARVQEAHYEGFRTFPKSRLTVAMSSVARMREAAKGNPDAYFDVSPDSIRREARNVGVETLTRNEWEAR